MEKLSCAQAKQIDLVHYLTTLGHHPHKVNREDHWYLSPFRDEKTPSFKVNRKLNVWFDFGEGKGGNLIDFGTRYLKCTVNELLEKLQGYHLHKLFLFNRLLRLVKRKTPVRATSSSSMTAASLPHPCFNTFKKDASR